MVLWFLNSVFIVIYGAVTSSGLKRLFFWRLSGFYGSFIGFYRELVFSIEF